MPRYHFYMRDDDNTPVAANFANDQAAIEDARRALADMMRDAALEGSRFDGEIKVKTEFGADIATVSLNSGGK